jgi:hypothetical protein
VPKKRCPLSARQGLPDPRAGSSAPRSLRGARVETTTLDPGLDPTALGNARIQTPLPESTALRAAQAGALAARLSPHIRGRLELAMTDNRTVLLSVKRDPRHRRYGVRLHRLFADLPAPLVRVLASFIENNDRASSLALNRYLDESADALVPLRRARPARTAIRTSGRCHDLRPIFDELNARYFESEIRCGITWGRQVARGRARRSLRVGSFCVEDDLIRIHPGLDQAWVPAFYLRWVLFHEMLHACHPIHRVGGRRIFHPREFFDAERRFDEHDRAVAWERQNVAALLCI